MHASVLHGINVLTAPAHTRRADAAASLTSIPAPDEPQPLTCASNRTRGDRSRLDGERSRTGGERSHHERWQEKKPTAFFRGRDWTCFGMRASAYAMRATPLCPNAKSRCARFYERGYYEGRDADAPVALTVSDPCYRARLVNGLRRWPRLFDVASGHEPRFVPVSEAAWEQSTPEPRAVHSSRRIPCTVHH